MPPIKILLVEHIVPLQRTLKSLLSQVGYDNVTSARDRQQAMGILKQGAIKLVIADWDIPPDGGVALLQTIRSDTAFKSLPVLLMIDDVDKNQVTSALQAGVTNLLLKPFSAAVVQEKIEAIFPSKATQGASAVPQALFARSR